MATVLNWSEQKEPNAPGFKDCTYAAGLTGMVFSGFTKFPKGIYTVEEREALERSDTQPNETGASLSDLALAIKTRYGKVKTPSGSSVTLTLLERDGLGLAIQGYLKNFPVGHKLRRWDPDFAGGHCVFLFKRNVPGTYRWFDPLAPMKFAGDNVTLPEIKTYMKGLGSSLTFRSDEYAPVVPVDPPIYTEKQMAEVKAQLADTQTRLENALKRALADEIKLADIKRAGGW